MIRRFHLLILLVVSLLFVGSDQAHALVSVGNSKALIQVFIPTPQTLTQFETTGLPVFARLNGVDGPYLLTGADVERLQSLDAIGLRYAILAPILSDGYYVASLMPNQTAPKWETFGKVLLDDGVQVLMQDPHVEALAQMGVKLRAISLLPKPLSVTRTVSFPEVVDPNPIVQTMIDQATTEIIENYTGGLSGEWPVMIGGSPYTIATRNTYTGTPIQKATQYVGEHLAALGLNVTYHQWGGATYPNVIGELPGQTNPNDIYIIGAHLDNMPPGALAPGADDNASGSVATLLAADIFAQYNWGCTLRFAFWTGEEQGLLGSAAYAQQAYNTGENILGYLNLDMIAWNTAASNPDIDLHATSALPATVALAQLYADVVDAYNLNLVPQVITNGTGFSDHASFWDYGYTSILGIEDYYGTGDFNPYYHTTADDMDNFQDWAYYTAFVKASLATFAHMTNCLIPGGVGGLDGHITAADGGAPISGATIMAENSTGQTFSTLTDANGYYTQTLIADTYTVRASAYGYVPNTLTGIPIITNTVTTADLVLSTAPTYTVSGTVLEAGTGQPLLAQVSARDTPAQPVWTNPVTGFYSLTLPMGTYTLEANAESHHPEQHGVILDQNRTQNFVLDPLACILLVDDDNNAPDVRPYYATVLNNLGYDYDVFDVGGGAGNGPDLTGLQGYAHIVWFTGDKYGNSAGPNGTDETALAAYLEAGGRLFLSAQDYLYDFGLTPFAQNYLGVASFTNDTGDATTKYGIPGDPIGNGLGPYPLSYPSGFEDFGDIVNPTASASVAFRSGSTGGNNLDLDKTNGVWKTVFFGTSWVPIYVNNTPNGEQALDQILTWFDGCEQLPEITLTPTALEATLTPNSSTDQTLQLGNTGTATLAWTLTEQPWVPWLDQSLSGGGILPGTTLPLTVTFDTTELEEGVYTTTLHLASNDPDESLIQIPVTLTVFEPCSSPGDLTFSWLPLAPIVNQPITFTAQVTGTEPLTLTWDFGDGTMLTFGISVSHVFTQTGTFTISLTAENSCGVTSVAQSVTVYAGPPPALNWKVYLPVIYCYHSETDMLK